ncbi:hypothetical protein ACLOJK_009981 [Asimina triloba]
MREERGVVEAARAMMILCEDRGSIKVMKEIAKVDVRKDRGFVENHGTTLAVGVSVVVILQEDCGTIAAAKARVVAILWKDQGTIETMRARAVAVLREDHGTSEVARGERAVGVL